MSLKKRLPVSEHGAKPLGTSLHAIFVWKLLNAPLARQTKIECFCPMPRYLAPFYLPNFLMKRIIFLL